MIYILTWLGDFEDMNIGPDLAECLRLEECQMCGQVSKGFYKFSTVIIEVNNEAIKP